MGQARRLKSATKGIFDSQVKREESPPAPPKWVLPITSGPALRATPPTTMGCLQESSCQMNPVTSFNSVRASGIDEDGWDREFVKYWLHKTGGS